MFDNTMQFKMSSFKFVVQLNIGKWRGRQAMFQREFDRFMWTAQYYLIEIIDFDRSDSHMFWIIWEYLQNIHDD